MLLFVMYLGAVVQQQSGSDIGTLPFHDADLRDAMADSRLDLTEYTQIP